MSITSELTKTSLQVKQEVRRPNNTCESCSSGLLFGPSPLVPVAALIQPQE